MISLQFPQCGSQSYSQVFRRQLCSKTRPLIRERKRIFQKERVVYGLQENRQRNSRMATSTLVHQGLYRSGEGNSGGARSNYLICMIRVVIRSPNRIFQNSESTRARSRKGSRPFALPSHPKQHPLRIRRLRNEFMPSNLLTPQPADQGPNRVL